MKTLTFNFQIDYSSTCDEKIPACKELSKKGKIHDALDQLLTLEKQTRTGADMVSTSRVLVAIVQICFDAKDWVTLNDHIALLAKRRYTISFMVTHQFTEYHVFIITFFISGLS